MFKTKPIREEGESIYKTPIILEDKEKIGVYGKPVKVTESNAIFRELETFTIEMIIMAILTMNAGLIVSLELLGAAVGVSWLAAVLLVAGMWGVWFYRYTIYQPRGNKAIVLRCAQNGAISIGVQKIKDRMISFDNTKNAQQIQITGVRRHWHNLTGRPVVVLVEDWPENVSIIKQHKPTMQSKDFSTILTNSYQTGYETGRNSIQRQLSGLLTPDKMVLILLLAIGAIGVLVFMQMGMLEEIGQAVGANMEGLI